tara:strand:+ start:39 stop:590 length:552 start_codon:yes stop_codon:yes gene_type:complete
VNYKIKKLQIQRIIQEYNLLNTDYELKNNMVDEYREEFLKETFTKEKKDNQENGPIKKEEVKIKNENIPNQTKSKIKKIYREIVKQTHPDKVNSGVLNNYYLEATRANNLNDVLELYIICEKLDIDVEVSDLELDLFNKLIEIKKSEIKKIEESFIWIWINSKTEGEKKEIVDRFIRFCNNNR